MGFTRAYRERVEEMLSAVAPIASKPMFGGRSAPQHGGGGGIGAVGPGFLALLGGLYGVRRWTQRRRSR